jgi:hypothetical protein
MHEGYAALRSCQQNRLDPLMNRICMLVLALAACGSPPAPVVGVKAPPSVTRFIIGGDSRDDTSHVLPWAFHEANARGAVAFVFLGDMELTPTLDPSFVRELALLDPIPFYPVLGNHEVKRFGFIGGDKAALERQFRKRFLDTPRTPVMTSIDGKVVYSTSLPGGVHFVALDNVSQKGFGDEQLAWLAQDLDRASADPHVRFIIVGMHKPLARNGVTTHGMDHDGERAVADSDAALVLLAQHAVALIVASHDHRFAQFTQASIPSYITGGLGAPLDRATPQAGFHHFLQVDVDDGPRLHVEVVRFPGEPSIGEEIDDD